MPTEIRECHLLVWQDDAGHEHVMHVHASESNARLMALHAALVNHGFRPSIFQPVDWAPQGQAIPPRPSATGR